MNYYFYHRIRLDSYGSPFRNVSSGIDWYEDKENVKRYEKGLSLYLDDFKSILYIMQRAGELRKTSTARTHTGSIHWPLCQELLPCYRYTPDQVRISWEHSSSALWELLLGLSDWERSARCTTYSFSGTTRTSAGKFREPSKLAIPDTWEISWDNTRPSSKPSQSAANNESLKVWMAKS